MSKRFPLAKWVLPQVIDPPTRTCFLVPVPDDINHRGAFMGAMLSLASAYKWQDDPDHKAVEVARVWREIFYSLKAQMCAISDTGNGTVLGDMLSQQIRISPDNSCIIQMWCVDHWEDWYDPRNCIASGSTQSGPQEPPPPGQYREACYPLQSNSRLLLPYSVKGGDRIEISGAVGGWSGGGLTWACPSGGVYGLGICGSPLAPVGTDPMPGEPHMRLIGHLIDDDVYFDAFNTTYDIPTFYAEQAVEFLANDSDLTDNAGSITLCVKTGSTGGIVHMISSTTGIINNRAILSKTSVVVGETFDFTLVAQSAPFSNPFDGIFVMDTPATLEIMSVSNWTPGTGWQWFDPPNGGSGAPTVGASQNTTGFAGNATTAGKVTFRLNSIP